MILASEREASLAVALATLAVFRFGPPSSPVSMM